MKSLLMQKVSKNLLSEHGGTQSSSCKNIFNKKAQFDMSIVCLLWLLWVFKENLIFGTLEERKQIVCPVICGPSDETRFHELVG